MTELGATDNSGAIAKPNFSFVYKHALATRIWHWVNVIAIFILIGSGLMIFNAHPHLYWGQYGSNLDTPWLSLPRFPGWMTIPSTYDLAMARRWHLFFSLIFGFGLLVFMISSIINRHFSGDLRLRLTDLHPRRLWTDIRSHLSGHFHDADNPAGFNLLQRIAYASVLFGILPLMIFTGLAMSPGMNAAMPWLLDLLGGRQSARSLHFIGLWSLVGFIAVHLALVLLSGLSNQIRSMITGYWRIAEDEN